MTGFTIITGTLFLAAALGIWFWAFAPTPDDPDQEAWDRLAGRDSD